MVLCGTTFKLIAGDLRHVKCLFHVATLQHGIFLSRKVWDDKYCLLQPVSSLSGAFFGVCLVCDGRFLQVPDPVDMAAEEDGDLLGEVAPP